LACPELNIPGGILGQDFTQEGTVTREWNNASALIEAGKLQLMLVERQWTMAFADLHPLLNAELRFDFRDQGIPYDDKIELLAERMHMDVRVVRPQVDLPFSEWISTYVRWCLENDPSGRGWPIADWKCDFGRASRFLAHIDGQHARGELPSAAEGSGRHDLDQLFTPSPDRLDLPLPRLDGMATTQGGWWRRLFGKGR